MSLSADPVPAPSSGTVTLDEAAQHANDAAGWVEQNWSTWLSVGLRILLILVIALVLRHVLRRTITKLIERMNRSATAVEGTALGGLLVNAERRRQRSEAIGSVMRSVTSFTILGTAALMVLGALNINLAPLLASAGVAGVALGFGARNLVTDFLSGVFMILEDQYGVGDTIDAGVASGEVIEVGLRVTKLRGDDGEIWYVRNGEVKRIGNLSQGWAGRCRCDGAAEREPGAGARRRHRGRGEDGEGGPLGRAAVGSGGDPGSGLGADRLDDAAGEREDHAGQGPGRGARAALADQAGVRRGGDTDRRRAAPRGYRGGAGRSVGGRGRAVGAGEPDVAAVPRGVPDTAAAGRPAEPRPQSQSDQIGLKIRRRRPVPLEHRSYARPRR